MPVALHANVSKGLLIVSSFQTRFDSGNSDAQFRTGVLPQGQLGNAQAAKRLRESVRSPTRSTVVLGVNLPRNLAEYELRGVRNRLGLVRGHGRWLDNAHPRTG